jgi:serine/threonine protein phosphatase PrpC
VKKYSAYFTILRPSVANGKEDGNMRVEASYISNIGKTRIKNEDSLLVNDLLISEANMDSAALLQSSGEKLIYVVADGMGGHQRGELASKTVLQVFRKRYPGIENAVDISEVIVSSKETLNGLAEADRLKYGMGTTVSGIFLTDRESFVFNCGDSRVYLLKDGFLERLTRDHSVVQELVDFGTITEDEMRFHSQKNIVTSAVIADLGGGLPEIDVKAMKISGDSTFLICTDGLWESMRREEMEECFTDHGKTVQCLFERAIAGGGRDNISAIVLRVTAV